MLIVAYGPPGVEAAPFVGYSNAHYLIEAAAAAACPCYFLPVPTRFWYSACSGRSRQTQGFGFEKLDH